MTAIAGQFSGLQRAVGNLTIRADLFRGAMALLIILNVSRIHQHFRWTAMFRPALTLAALATIYAFLNPRQLSTRGLLDTPPARAILALALFACVSAPFGLSLGSSGRFILEGYSKVIVVALLLIAAVRNSRDLYTFVWAYVIGCGLLAYLSIFVFGLQEVPGGGMARLNDLYTYDANDIGVVLMVGLPLTLLALQSSSGIWKVIAGVILIGIGVTLARSGSRGAFVGLIATGVALLFLVRTIPIWKRAAFVVVTGVTLVLAAPAGYWEQMQTMLSPKEDYNWTSTDGRREVTKRGMSYMLSYPVFGLGINNFYRAECIDPVSDKVRFHQAGTGIRCGRPHNSFLQAGAELGVPGLALWLFLVLGGIVGMLRLRRRLPALWKQGTQEQRFLYLATMYFAVAMIGFAVTAFFVSFAWVDIGYTLAALMAGLYICASNVSAARAEAPVSALPALNRRTGRPLPYRPAVHFRR